MTRKIVKTKFIVEDEHFEKIAEVSEDKSNVWSPEKELKIVGKPVSRYDGYDKVSGTAVYTFDVKLKNMAYARILGALHPNAQIRSINISKAESLPGVLYILTSQNCPSINWYWNTGKLFDTHTRYIGDEVACVIAETEMIAEEALKLIEVEYEILPFVTTAAEAMKTEAVKLHDWGNVTWGKPSTYSRGDIEQGFKDADLIIEEEFTTPVVIHNPTEVHCCVVNWEGDQLTVYDSTQAIFNVRETIAESLGLPNSKVRVIKKYMGGGFGSKLEAGKYSVMAALAAKEIGRPVRITMSRKQMGTSMGNRPDSYQKLKAGIKKDGTLTALSHYSYGSVGAYPNGAGCAWPLRSLYKCANVSIEEYSVVTNLGRARAMRAPGHVQGTFAFESFIDDLAEKINMDPIEFRLKNYSENDPENNNPYTTKKLKEAYIQGSKAIGWERRKAPGSDKGSKKHGIGMASQIWWGGGTPPSGAVLKLNWDGSAQIHSGTQDLGTGTYTFISQIVAEVLEIPMDNIQVIIGDTETCPYSTQSGGSLTAPSVSPAIKDAAEQMKTKLISSAAVILETTKDNIKYESGIMSLINDAEKKLTIPQVFEKLNEAMLVTTGNRNANPEGYSINTFGAHFAEVEVDTDTGKVKVIKIVAAHDIGRVLNRKTLDNQIHGGVIQALGFALLEERVVDHSTGIVLNSNMHDYKLPTIKDIPLIETIIVSEADNLISNVGTKGVGEPAHIPGAAAIANAVYNAIGTRIKDLPITPDKILMALNKKNTGAEK